MNILELLTEDEVEVAATLGTEYLVETIGPVDTHQAHHRQVDAYTKASTALHVERIELLGFGPSITSLDKT